MTAGKKDMVYIFGDRIPGKELPPVDRERIERAKKHIAELRKEDQKNK